MEQLQSGRRHSGLATVDSSIPSGACGTGKHKPPGRPKSKSVANGLLKEIESLQADKHGDLQRPRKRNGRTKAAWLLLLFVVVWPLIALRPPPKPQFQVAMAAWSFEICKAFKLNHIAALLPPTNYVGVTKGLDLFLRCSSGFLLTLDGMILHYWLLFFQI
jgi:hypothetical protein